MKQKLDPNLRALVEAAGDAQSESPVQVIVGLAAPATQPEIDALREMGLRVRSIVGDVLTGTAPVAQIPRIAEHDLVTRIEASAPLRSE